MSQKLWQVFVSRQLCILNSKINFEVLYFTQFWIYFEKNKIIECRSFITTLQPLGLSFFNSITKILYFESFFTSFYLLFFFLYVVQFQMIWNFSTMYPTCLEEWIQRSTTISDILSYKCELVKCNCLVFRKAKNRIFVNLQVHILQST